MLSLIDRALELNSSDPSLADTRAVILIRSGQHDRALEQLRAVQQQDPRDPGVAFHMAWAYRAKGDLNSARAMLQAAERLGLGPRTLDPRELAVLEEFVRPLVCVQACQGMRVLTFDATHDGRRGILGATPAAQRG